jgi:transposase
MPSLKDSLPKISNRRPSVLLIDSSGLKSYGCEEWLRFHHRIKTRSRWIKIHIGLDPSSQEVISYEVTSSSGGDAKQLPILLEKSPKSIDEVIADGAYDTQSCREAIAKRGAKALIRPRKGSLTGIKNYPGSDERDEAVNLIRGLGNDKQALDIWKKLRRYGRRSLVETFFSRMKQKFGSRIQSKTIDRQWVEVGLKLRLLNQEISAVTSKN